MSPVTNGRVLFTNYASGFMKPGVTTKYVEEQIDLDTVPLNGGILLKTLALSSDPYLRDRMRHPDVLGFASLLALGQPVDNFAVAKVLRSEDERYAPGDVLSGFFNFETYSVWPGPVEQLNVYKQMQPKKLDLSSGISPSLFCGSLGMAGESAYSGMKVLAEEKVKKSQTMFVSNAAGPLGSLVVQLAKIANPNIKVIGSAGNKEKVDFVKAVGADVAFNYKEQDTDAVLKEHGPIDVYWDNVSGTTLDTALNHMQEFGLIIACGAISGYNSESQGVKNFERVFQRSLTIRGFLYGRGGEQQQALENFVPEIGKLILEGKIITKEHRYIGLQNAEQALLDVHTGANVGKVVVIVAEE